MQPLRATRSSLTLSLILSLTVGTALLAPTAHALEPGDKAPQFSARSLDGTQTLSMSKYRGKVVYLDFWASWCGPCLKSLPMMEAMRKEFAGSGLQVIAVNVDKDLGKAKKFVKKHDIGYPSAQDPEGRLPGTFQVETMPTSFVIDRNGVIRHIHKGFKPSDMEEIREQVKSLLAE